MSILGCMRSSPPVPLHGSGTGNVGVEECNLAFFWLAAGFSPGPRHSSFP